MSARMKLFVPLLMLIVLPIFMLKLFVRILPMPLERFTPIFTLKLFVLLKLFVPTFTLKLFV